MPVDSAILDGELVALLPSGISSFQALQNAGKLGSDAKLVYYAFDLLYLDGYDLRRLPLEQRKRIDGLDPTRADVILAGALILAEAMRALKREQMEVCGRGLRWGLIYERFAK